MMKMIGHIFKRHRRITRILAALVVFLTTYALILPALTLDKETAVEQSGVTLGRGDESVHSDDEQGSDLGKETLAGLSQTSEDDINSSEEKAMLITEPTTLTFESEQYTVKVRIDDRAKLPSDVTLRVSELTPESRQIKQEEIYRQLGDGVFGVHFYDISLWSKDKEVEPAGPVEVEVSYKTPLEISRQYSLMAIHYHPEAGAEFLRLDAKRKDKQISSVSFTTDHFSEYGFVQALPKAINAAVNDGRTLFNIIFQSDGQEITSISDVESGTPIGQLPENPFKEGYRFDSWKNAKTGEPVTSETLVTEDMLVEAVFVPISIYTISVEYYYHNNSSHQDVVFDKETYQKEEKDTPLQITPPASTKVSRGEDPTLQADSVYYPEKSIVEIAPGQLADLDSKDGQRDNHVTLKVQFVPSTATFEYVYLLKNLTGNGYSEMKRVEAHGVLNSTVYPQVLTFPNANFERTEAKEITQASGQKLNVYYTRKSYNLSYETNGGSYIDPQTGLYEQEIPITKTIPTRTGYDFAGWYDNPSFSGRAVTRSTKLSSDKTLYAKWTPRKVNYTIAYYREVYDNATGTTSYVYESSRLAQATVGDTIQATSATVPGLSSSSIPTGYEKERAYGKNASSSVTIEPDGTSVLNVYYSLKRYTFIFDLNGPVVNNWGRTISNSIGSSRGVININNGAYTNRQYVVRDVVMDQDISNLWPTGDQIYDSLGEYSFKGWKYASDAAYYVTRRQKVTPDLVTLANSNNEITYSAYWQRGLITKRVEYYLESPEGDYVLSNEHSQTYQTTRKSNLSGKNISGFTYYYERNINYPYSNDVATYRFYYKRDRYKINYMYGSQTVKTTPDIPFDANINTSDYNYRPTRPKGVDSDYTWGGWYADAGLNTPYQFTTMPANHLVLYAKWIAPTFKVNFDLNGADGQAPNSQQVEKYKTVTVPPNPSREHYDFVGWYTEPTGGSRYDWSKPVTTDSTLYARWRPKPITYTVKYLEEGTETPLATEKVESNPAFVKGQTISEKALAISGYRPAERSQSIQLDHGKNVITFYYTKKAPTVTYTIKYVLADNPAIEVAPSQTKVVDGSWLSAKEKAVPVDKEHFGKQAGVTPDMLALDYYPIDNVEELVLSSVSQNNVITFRYANYETAKIKVNYLDMDGNPIPGQDSLTVLKKKPGSYSVNRKAISGYTFEKSIDNQKAENKTYYK
ncbi:InlB B-repeat-containing protein, partial [Streptococcus merionis]|uniref:InlB B-repeat-containing protein n=1 Tax=Streptococcus merionis TaxID=400065 RepID=UPI0026F1CE77